MANILYGVLKGTITGHLRDADDDHYQVLVSAGSTMFRVAVNVHSTLRPPDLLFQSLTSLPSTLRQQLTALKTGFAKLASKPGGLAQDFVRGGIVKSGKFKVVPGDTPGADNDLKDTMEDAAIAAIDQEGFRVAVNVHSTLRPPDLLFQSLTSLPSTLRQQLTDCGARRFRTALEPFFMRTIGMRSASSATRASVACLSACCSRWRTAVMCQRLSICSSGGV